MSNNLAVLFESQDVIPTTSREEFLQVVTSTLPSCCRLSCIEQFASVQAEEISDMS